MKIVYLLGRRNASKSTAICQSNTFVFELQPFSTKFYGMLNIVETYLHHRLHVSATNPVTERRVRPVSRRPRRIKMYHTD